MERSLTISDFMTGLLAALSLQGVTSLNLRNKQLDRAMAKLFSDIKRQAEEQGFPLRFRICLHPLHNDSIVVRKAIYDAAQRNLVSLDNPVYEVARFKISQQDADHYLNNVVGTSDMYKQLARKFVEYYKEQE
jgi:hypothetical protein